MAHFGWLTYQTDDFPNYVFQRHFHHFHQDLGQILWYWWWNIMEYSSKTVGEILLQKSWEGKVQQKRQVNVMDDVFLGVICFVGPLGPLGPHGGFGRRIQVKFGEMVKWIFSDIETTKPTMDDGGTLKHAIKNGLNSGVDTFFKWHGSSISPCRAISSCWLNTPVAYGSTSMTQPYWCCSKHWFRHTQRGDLSFIGLV